MVEPVTSSARFPYPSQADELLCSKKTQQRALLEYDIWTNAKLTRSIALVSSKGMKIR